MNILLLNDNPVVTKLVTLSAQKTGSEILIASNMEEIQDGSYDLLIVDEALYTHELMDELKSKISYKQALYMLSRGASSVDGFDKEVKKPFLPTDLVELLSSISVAVSNMKDKNVDMDLEEDFDMSEDIKNEIFNDSLKEDELNFDDFDNINLDAVNTENDDIGSILDHEDVQEVKNLLDEEELETHVQEDKLILDNEFDLDDEFNFDSLDLEDSKEEILTQTDELEEDFSFDDLDLLEELKEDTKEANKPLLEDEFEDTTDEVLEKDEILITDEMLPHEDSILDEELDFEEESILENELKEENAQEESDDDLEAKIESAVAELSSEDLNQEIDFSFDDLSELETLDEKSLKIALGEEIDDTTEDELISDEEEILSETKADLEENISDKEIIEEAKVELETKNDGVEALKVLLKALNNEDVVASLKGMNVSINISFGNSSDE